MITSLITVHSGAIYQRRRTYSEVLFLENRTSIVIFTRFLLLNPDATHGGCVKFLFSPDVLDEQPLNSLRLYQYIPAKCPGGLLEFYWGCVSKKFHRNWLFFAGIQSKGAVWKWPGMLKLRPGINACKIFYPRWLIFYWDGSRWGTWPGCPS